MQLVWLVAAWLSGIVLGLAPGAQPWALLLLSLAALLLAAGILWVQQRLWLCFAALLLLCGAAGCWRSALLPAPTIDLPAGSITALRGKVTDWPRRGDGTDTAELMVTAARSTGRWQPATAQVQVLLPFAPAVGAADQLTIYGYYRPRTTIASGSVQAALARRGLAGQFYATQVQIEAVGARDTLTARRIAALNWTQESLRRHIPGAEGALATGVLLGDDRQLAPLTRKAFVATGTSHIMALSGWNIALVAGLCALIGRWLQRGRARWWLAGSAVVIWGFVCFVGFSPSLVRAAIMGSIYLLAEAVGRRGDALSALAFTAFLMTLHNPQAINDIGFQLSCAATLGLIVASPTLLAWLQRLRVPLLLAAPTAATLTAELATVPLSMHHFGQVSFLTLPANLLVEWPVPLIMSGGVLTALASLLPGPLADALGLLTWLPSRVMLLTVETLGNQPWALRTIAPPGWLGVALLYALLALVLRSPVWFGPLRQWMQQVSRVVTTSLWAISAGLVLALLLWCGLLVLLP